MNEIRPLSSIDAQAFFELRLFGLQESPSAFCESASEFVKQDLKDLAERIDEGLKNNSVIFGCFEAKTGRLLGVAGLRQEHAEKRRHRAVLWGMFVSPVQRRSGVARELMRSVVKTAKENPEVQQIALSVEAENQAAIRLYNSFGFEKYGHEPKALRLGDRFFDQYHMILEI